MASKSEIDTERYRNFILYGPPGTGKTYNTVIYAVAICQGVTVEELSKKSYKEILKDYNKLKDIDNQIAFTTFHQSYGYEEFIEGIKPIVDDDEIEGKLLYKKEDGIFKAFCNNVGKSEIKSSDFDINKNANIWKITIKYGEMNEIKNDCFENGRVRIGFKIDDPNAKAFVEYMQTGDIVISLKDRKTVDAIGVITSEEVYVLPNTDTYSVSRNVKWLAINIAENIYKINGNRILHRATVSRVPHMKLKDIIEVAKKNNPKLNFINEANNNKNYVFIIDEINRGNISKIFGELITLIEESKREGAEEAMSASLPYTGDNFIVPKNVFVLGTMNTADRSIALMDTALRRRFKFIEAMPKPEVLAEIGADKVDEIDVVEMLKIMNSRIEYLFDRDHTIGHAYFTPLKDDASIENLAHIFKNAIIPLLQEYFYEDYSKIRMVLGDNGKADELQFFKQIKISVKALFKGDVSEIDELDNMKYEIQNDAFYNPKSYIEIYS